MAEFLGSTGPIIVTVMGTGTTATPLTGVTNVRVGGRSPQNRVEVTVAGDVAIQYLDGLPDTAAGVCTVTGYLQDGSADIAYALLPGVTGLTVIVGLQGTGTNKPKSTGSPCTITSKDIGGGFKEAQPYTFEFTKNTGAFVEGTF